MSPYCFCKPHCTWYGSSIHTHDGACPTNRGQRVGTIQSLSSLTLSFAPITWVTTADSGNRSGSMLILLKSGMHWLGIYFGSIEHLNTAHWWRDLFMCDTLHIRIYNVKSQLKSSRSQFYTWTGIGITVLKQAMPTHFAWYCSYI